MDKVNQLTEAEEERLVMLAEECSEVIQIVSKILRHGYKSYHPNDPTTTNRRLLMSELTDVHAVLRMMEVGGDIPTISDDSICNTIVKKKRFAHHQ